MSNTEFLFLENNREVRAREREQHRYVLGLIMPVMPETAARDLNKVHEILEAREDRNLNDLYLEAVRYRGRYRSAVAAGHPTPDAVANLQIAGELSERISFVTKLARMNHYAEPGEKSRLQEEMQASEVLPDRERVFWVTCADVLIAGEGIDRRAAAAELGSVALVA